MAQAPRTAGRTGIGVTPPVDARDALVADAEAALARGDAVSAAESFERASAMLHSAAIEMGLVRALMQVGRYRRALALCAHVAGEHLDAPGASILYAWLLRIGGRRDLADGVLREALARAPSEPVTLAGARALASPLPVASGLLLNVPHRVAPFATGASGAKAPTGSRVVSSGVLLPGGRHALVPGRPRGSSILLRDGLGATSGATLVDDGTGEGDLAAAVTTLWTLDAVGAGVDDVSVNAQPVAGTPVFAVEFAETDDATPAWPWLRGGFLGARTRDGDAFRLGVDLVAGHGGGAVLDAAGRLLGTTARDAQGRSTMRPLGARLGTVGADLADRVAPAAGRARVDLAFDQLYEQAMRVTVQVIVPA